MSIEQTLKDKQLDVWLKKNFTDEQIMGILKLRILVHLKYGNYLNDALKALAADPESWSDGDKYLNANNIDQDSLNANTIKANNPNFKLNSPKPAFSMKPVPIEEQQINSYDIPIFDYEELAKNTKDIENYT